MNISSICIKLLLFFLLISKELIFILFQLSPNPDHLRPPGYDDMFM
jgi:hypothetical protein